MSSQKQRSASGGTVDALFAALADTRRRAVVRNVAEERPPLGLEFLTRQIERCERSRTDGRADDGDGGGRDKLREIRISLVHCHLPKLADARILDVDAEENLVAEGPRFRTAMAHLELV